MRPGLPAARRRLGRGRKGPASAWGGRRKGGGVRGEGRHAGWMGDSCGESPGTVAGDSDVERVAQAWGAMGFGRAYAPHCRDLGGAR